MSARLPHRVAESEDGAFFAVPAPDQGLQAAVERKLGATTETPIPDAGDGGYSKRGGAAPRVTNRYSKLGIPALRRIALGGHEMGDAIRLRRDELYRNEFPLLKPRFGARCEDCGAEFGDDPRDGDADDAGGCPNCDADTDALRDPDPAQKREAERLFESVNRAGESLRDLAKRAEEDQWVAGVSTIVIRYDYVQAPADSTLYDAGEIIAENPESLLRADPAALRPVVDEHGRPGGVWWVCPVHRGGKHLADEPGTCACGAERREVWFVEDAATDDTRYYLRDEVVTWAYPAPRLHGLDGLAPAAQTWIKQAILSSMDRYAGAYYNPEADRKPGTMVILHTTNPDRWEAELTKAKQEDGDPYDSAVFTDKIEPGQEAESEVEVVDIMSDELLGQAPQTRDALKSDIRQAFGVSDVHDSDLSDAGGLNNEGLQLEVTDRSIASQQHDYVEGWLDTLMKRLGFDDWRIEFLPATGPDAKDLQDELRAGALAKQAGLEARFEDGEVAVSDGELDLSDEQTAEGFANLPGVGSPVPNAGGGGGGPPGGGGGGGGLAAGPSPPDTPTLGQAAVETLEAATHAALRGERVTLADAVHQAGGPHFAEDEDISPRIRDNVQRALLRHDFRVVESASSAELSEFFAEKLTQPQGWSVESLAEDLQTEVGVTDPQTAETLARTEATAILNKAKELAIEDLAEGLEDEEPLHYWDGPQDDRTTERCEWLKRQTNPDYGGDPVPMAELRDLEREAIDRHGGEGGSGDVRDHVLHPNCRHTFRTTFAE
jgi:hypothetical protein